MSREKGPVYSTLTVALDSDSHAFEVDDLMKAIEQMRGVAGVTLGTEATTEFTERVRLRKTIAADVTRLIERGPDLPR